MSRTCCRQGQQVRLNTQKIPFKGQGERSSPSTVSPGACQFRERLQYTVLSDSDNMKVI